MPLPIGRRTTECPFRLAGLAASRCSWVIAARVCACDFLFIAQAAFGDTHPLQLWSLHLAANLKKVSFSFAMQLFEERIVLRLRTIKAAELWTDQGGGGICQVLTVRPCP
jgi:hypothetical protein